MTQTNITVEFIKKGLVSHCLGMKVIRDRQNGISSLNQSEYAQKLLELFGMSNAKHIATPMVLNKKLRKPGNDNGEENVL
ncbi:hypothetical protein ILUMI_21286 [Ignelater luminosus]|uniref:Reverse transcriptase Ty1/copia-type domain-containing protein n=1 Tax=Ignelater luminosus TaxID=2038154 RepID=A0A8K0CCH6_IGNLU|nr:hypothetical protein ILUMI_21286 [Ignelater luminosus]